MSKYLDINIEQLKEKLKNLSLKLSISHGLHSEVFEQGLRLEKKIQWSEADIYSVLNLSCHNLKNHGANNIYLSLHCKESFLQIKLLSDVMCIHKKLDLLSTLDEDNFYHNEVGQIDGLKVISIFLPYA